MELLAPAGNITKLKTAFSYGADAVYLGSAAASMRSGGGAEFNDELSLAVGINYAHTLGKRAYLAANIFPHNRDLNMLQEYFTLAEKLKPNGIIVSDLGAFDLCQKYAPSIPIHISTQANNVNWRAAKKWHELGAKRIILARELSLDEVRDIREHVDPSLELEVFVHGAMCVAYSGRCLLSQYLTYRNANKGVCAQPCRWHANVTIDDKHSSPPVDDKHAAVTFDDQEFTAEENNHGTFLLNSKDLCLIKHIAALADCGVDSLKIEGRNKSEYYVAAVTKTYRKEIDRFLNGLPFDPQSLNELEKVSHREYCEGLENINSSPDANSSQSNAPSQNAASSQNSASSQIYGTSSYIRSAEVMAVVTGHQPEMLECEQRGKIIAGDTLEVLTPTGDNITIEKAEIFSPDSLSPLDSTPHAEMKFRLKCPSPAPEGSFVRKLSLS